MTFEKNEAKLCTKCHKNPRVEYQRWCAECRKEYNRNYQQTHKAQRRARYAQMKKRRKQLDPTYEAQRADQTNKYHNDPEYREKVKERSRQYYKEHREKCSDYQREYRKKHKAKAKMYHRYYYFSHLDKFKEYKERHKEKYGNA